MKCLLARPIVNGLERDLEGRADVVRLNMLSKEGREVASRYEVRGLPHLLVLDGAGKVIYRKNGLLDRKAVLARLGTA